MFVQLQESFYVQESTTWHFNSWEKLSVEFITFLELSVCPSPKHLLKSGSPSNSNVELGRTLLCNGRRLIVKQNYVVVTFVYQAFSQFKQRVIEAMEILLMSGIPIISSDLPHIFKYLQFLLEADFFMTIKKAQVVSLHVQNQGFYLKQLCTWRMVKLKRF